MATKPDRAREVVAAGYDRLGDRYRTWAAGIVDDSRERIVTDLVDRLPECARVLDLGCGPGVPTGKRLAERYDVIGVDLSMAQLRLARAAVPAMALVQSDMSDVAFRPGSFDAVAALFSLGHVPRDRHAEVFTSMGRWLRPGGLALFALPTGDDAGMVEEWLGVDMFFSGHEPDVSRRLLADAGFELILDDVETVREPQGEVSFLWVLARRSA